MTTRRFIVPLVALAVLVGAFGVVPRAEEGFWPYNLVPKAAIKAKYKFDVTDAWLKHLQLATVRFGGGTGSIVSPQGLVLTNHHIGLGTLQRLSTAEKDYVKNGFYAPTLADELKVPGMSLMVLQSIEDVTEKVAAAVTPSMTPQEISAARQKAVQAIQGELQQGVSKQVVPLYAGAVYHLYTYKVYTRRAPRVRRRVPDRLLRRRRGQLHVPALQHRRVDVPALRERQAGPDAELPAVVAEGIRRGRADLHDRAPRRDAAPEHAGALQVPPRPAAAVRHREQRDARSGGEEVDGAERRERAAVHQRAVRHPEQPEVPARPAEGPAGPGRDREEGSRGEAAARRARQEPGQAAGTRRRVGRDRQVPRGRRASSTPSATSSRMPRA